MSDGAADSDRSVAVKKKTMMRTRPPDGWTRCHMYVERKKRFCRQEIVKGSCYCGNHQPEQQQHPLRVQHQRRRRRIPCPMDPSHLIYEDRIQKHLKICPLFKRKQSQEKDFYYQHNINIGGYGTITTTLLQRTTTTTMDQQKTTRAHALAFQILNVYQRVFGDGIPELDLSHAEMQAGCLPHSIQHYRIKSGGVHHLRQQASLVGHLRRIIGLMDTTTNTSNDGNDDNHYTLLEMGAGRGMLGLIAAGVVAASSSSSSSQIQLCLVERSGSRSKADTVLRTAAAAATNSQTTTYMNLQRVQWSRIQCDLSHVHIPSVLCHLSNEMKKKKQQQHQQQQQQQMGIRKTPHDSTNGETNKLIVIAKHLCGQGTDLALKSLQEVQPDACIMATCCHGVCSWENYVGRDFLRNEFGKGNNDTDTDALDDFGPFEFELMRRWSSGTVIATSSECSHGSSSSNDATTDRVVESTDDNMEKMENNTNQDEQQQQQQQHGNVVAMDDDDAKDPMNVSSICASLGLTFGPQGLGRACQRLLDQGRCDYLRRVLFCDTDHETCQIEMFHYVPCTVTPQNAVLTAYRVSKTQQNK